MKTIYLASPYGFMRASREYQRLVAEKIKVGSQQRVRVQDPWEGGGSVGSVVNARAIAARNETMIRESDLVVACLDGTDVDSGVAAEIGLAYGLGIPVIGYREDLRRAGEIEGVPINLQVWCCLTLYTNSLDELPITIDLIFEGRKKKKKAGK